jgi:flagellar motility protein MotE (MotC chaperone)
MTRHRLSVLDETREEKRRVWQERRREWKAVQKVLERERARWQTQELKEEQKMIDEIAQNSAGVPAGGTGNGGPRRDRGSAMKAVLMVVLVLALSVAMLYSIRLAGRKHIAFFERGIVFGDRTVQEEPEVFRVAREVSSGTRAVAATPTPAVGSGMLITSDMIEDTLAQVEAERERLREREVMLDAWEKRLTRRQEELEGLIKRYDGLRAQIETYLTEQRALKEWRESEERKEREADIKRLARLYEKAKAREAATMMLELDRLQAQEVLLAMSERQAVRILGEMSKANPERASELLESLSEELGRLAPSTPTP